MSDQTLAALLHTPEVAAAIPGLSLAVVQAGQLASTHAIGYRGTHDRAPVDTDTVFEAASLTKPLVSHIALQVAEEGLLDLNQPLENRSELKTASHCHCHMCQKAHGAAFGSYGTVLSADYVVTAGAESLKRYASSPGVVRGFCGQCGSTLTWNETQGQWADYTGFTLGTLDTPLAPQDHRHLHPDSRAAWHE